MGGASHGTSHGRHRAGSHHGAHAGIVQAGIVHACVARQVAVAGGGALAEPKRWLPERVPERLCCCSVMITGGRDIAFSKLRSRTGKVTQPSGRQLRRVV